MARFFPTFAQKFDFLLPLKNRPRYLVKYVHLSKSRYDYVRKIATFFTFTGQNIHLDGNSGSKMHQKLASN